MKDIFTALCALLIAVDGIEHVDRLHTQLSKPKKDDSYKRPAVFIKFYDIKWKSGNLQQQTGELHIEFFVVSPNISESYSSTAGGQTLQASGQDAALANYDLLDTLHLALQSFSGDTFSPLDAVASKFDQEMRNGEIIDVLTYHTTVTRNTQQPQQYIEGAPVTIQLGSRPETDPGNVFVINP